MREREIWDREWQRYSSPEDSRWDLELFRRHQLHQIVRSYSLGRRVPLKLHEVASGSATLSLSVAKMFPVKLYLLDLSDPAVAISRMNVSRAGVSDLQFTCGDITAFPFASGTFDVVYSGGVNEHFVGLQRRRALEEMIRVKARSGMVLVHVPNSLCFPYRIGKFLLERFKLWRWGLEISYSRREIEFLARQIGEGNWPCEAAAASNFLGSVMWIPPFILLKMTRSGVRVAKYLGKIRLRGVAGRFSEWLSIRIEKASHTG